MNLPEDIREWPVAVIETQCDQEFMSKARALFEQGFTLSQSACGIATTSNLQPKKYWMGIFVNVAKPMKLPERLAANQ